MEKSVFFLNDINNELILEREINSESKIFCFDIKSHYYLEKKSIEHELSEDYISEQEKEKIFKLAVELWKWYEKNDVFNKINIENINYFGILDTSEFHQLIIDKIKYFVMIKRIIEKEIGIKKIFVTEQLEKLVQPFLGKNNIELIVIKQKSAKHNTPIYENVTIPVKLMGIKKNVVFSRKKYFKIKNFVEKIGGKIFGLTLKNFKKECILFLDINPNQYKELFENLKNKRKDLVFFNSRRSVLSDLESIRMMRKIGGKIITPNLILDTNEKKMIKDLVFSTENDIKEIFKKTKIFEKIFMFEGYQFWSSIEQELLKIYLTRIEEYFKLVFFGKKIIHEINASSIVLLNVIGEGEKIIQKMNHDEKKIILLEHAFTNYNEKNIIYDILRINYNGKNAVWGKAQSDYLTKLKHVDEKDILITGSPRHDSFHTNTKNKISQKYLLILPHTLTSFNAISGIRTFEKQITILEQIIESMKNYPGVEPIIKLHPVQDLNNKFFKAKIQELFPQVRIFQNEPILEVMEYTGSVISILGEVSPSTTLLEGLILEKPILFIDITKKDIPFEFIQDNAVIAIKDESQINQSINDLINNEKLRDSLIRNGSKFTEKYLSFTGNASKRFSEILCDMK